MPTNANTACNARQTSMTVMLCSCTYEACQKLAQSRTFAANRFAAIALALRFQRSLPYAEVAFRRRRAGGGGGLARTLSPQQSLKIGTLPVVVGERLAESLVGMVGSARWHELLSASSGTHRESAARVAAAGKVLLQERQLRPVPNKWRQRFALRSKAVPAPGALRVFAVARVHPPHLARRLFSLRKVRAHVDVAHRQRSACAPAPGHGNGR